MTFNDNNLGSEPWPDDSEGARSNNGVLSVSSVLNAGQSLARVEPPLVLREISVRNNSSSDTSDADTNPPTRDSDTSDASDTDLLGGTRTGDWLSEQTFPPLRFSVPGIVPAGFCVLAGPPKAGKSWLLLDWLLAIQAGGVALGKIPVGEPRHVLYMALEDSDRRMQDRCNTLLQGAKLTSNFVYLTRVIPAQVIATAQQFMERHPDTGMIAIDTLGKVMPPITGGETTYQRDYRIGGHLQQLAVANPGMSVVVAHHTRKTASDDFVDSVSGTNGLAGAADTIIVLARNRLTSDGVLNVTGRDIDESAYGLVSDRGSWRLEGADLSDAAMAAQERADTENLGGVSRDILDYFAQHTEGLRAKDVAGKFGGNAYRYLSRLHESGKLDKLERGIYCLAGRS